MGRDDLLDNHPSGGRSQAQAQTVEHGARAFRLRRSTLDRELVRWDHQAARVDSPSNGEAQDAEAAPEPALEIEEAEMQAGWCRDTDPGMEQSLPK